MAISQLAIAQKILFNRSMEIFITTTKHIFHDNTYSHMLIINITQKNLYIISIK